MVKFIVFDSGSDASRLMFEDVKKMPDTVETSSVFRISNPLLKIMNKAHMNLEINRKINLPFKKIWDKFCFLEEAKKDAENEYIIVMTNVSVKKFRIGYLRSLKEYANIHLVLIVVDSFIDKYLCPIDIMSRVDFELVYSFDRKDCEKYNMIFTQAQYSKREGVKPAAEHCDLFFIGRAKDRLKLLKSIANKAVLYGLKIKFFVMSVPRNEREEIEGVSYIDEVIPYDKILPIMLSSDCFVDLVQKGQSGFTMRVYEAVFYNKKLITNNSSIVDFPYYRDKWIKYFDNVDELDRDFFTDSDKVDFKYKGEYSPIHLLKDMKVRLFNN